MMKDENASLAGTGEALGNATDKVNFTSGALRQQALSEAKHLALTHCFNGVRAEASEALDIRQIFYTPSVAADPDRARPKLDGRAIVLAAVEAESIVRKGFKPKALAMLAVDFDGDNLSASDIHAAVVDFFGAEAIWCTYSTASSQPDNRRWRLFIPLAQPVALEVWLRMQRGFAAYLKERGVTVDATAERATQLHFLPTVPWSIKDKQGREVVTRNPFTGEPLHFEHEFGGVSLFDPAGVLTTEATQALSDIDEQDRAAEEQAQEAARKRQQQLASGGDGMTPVERFNLEHSTEALMLKYGYAEDPNKPGHWRSPLQNSGTFATQVREDGSWFSLSGSDAAAGLGAKQGSGVGGDAFDLFVHFEHRGHRAKAVAIAGQQQASKSAFSAEPLPQGVSMAEVTRPFGNGANERLSSKTIGVFSQIAELQGRPESLAPDGKGGYAASKHNLMTALMSEGFCFDVGFDEFLGEVLVREPDSQQWRQLREDDFFNAALCLEGRDFRSISTQNMREAILAAAREQAFDSAKDWLNALPVWDGVDRAGAFLEQAFGVAPSEYATAVSRYVWSALAGRVLKPGCKCDMVPVVAGRQGAGKSTVVKAIAPFETGFGELNLASKEEDLFRQMKGRLVMELPELSGMRKRESEDLKRFVASTTNVWIEKHEKTKSIYPRRCIFFGTTNETAILNDPTGSRRWLPFECGTCNPQWVIDNREQLWAQGAAMFKESGVHYEAAERLARDVHEDFRANDPWEVQIARWLKEASGLSGVAPESRNAITTAEVMAGLGIPTSQQNRAIEMRAGNALKALGYERTRVMTDGNRRYVYQKALR